MLQSGRIALPLVAQVEEAPAAFPAVVYLRNLARLGAAPVSVWCAEGLHSAHLARCADEPLLKAGQRGRSAHWRQRAESIVALLDSDVALWAGFDGRTGIRLAGRTVRAWLALHSVITCGTGALGQGGDLTAVRGRAAVDDCPGRGILDFMVAVRTGAVRVRGASSAEGRGVGHGAVSLRTAAFAFVVRIDRTHQEVAALVPSLERSALLGAAAAHPAAFLVAYAACRTRASARVYQAVFASHRARCKAKTRAVQRDGDIALLTALDASVPADRDGLDAAELWRLHPGERAVSRREASGGVRLSARALRTDAAFIGRIE